MHTSQLLGPPSILKYHEKKSYRAKTDTVSPRSARTKFEQFDSCFLGISLGNNNFSDEKLKAMIAWISRRFSRCIVLVGDSIHRITLETTQSLKAQEALAQALEMGETFMHSTKNLFDKFGADTQFSFETCSQIQESHEYQIISEGLQNFFNENDSFRKSVESFSRHYHLRQSYDPLEAPTLEYRVRRSCDYFLEEFAVFACLQMRGFSVMIYPGTFSTLTEIVEGKHPDVFEALQKLIIVSLHFKTR